MKTLILSVAAVLTLAAHAKACIELMPIDAIKFAAIDHPFIITFQDSGDSVNVTISYEPNRNKFGVLSTIHGDLKVEPAEGKELSKWVVSKTAREIRLGPDIAAGKSFPRRYLPWHSKKRLTRR
jgi:hypothetical protein